MYRGRSCPLPARPQGRRQLLPRADTAQRPLRLREQRTLARVSRPAIRRPATAERPAPPPRCSRAPEAPRRPRARRSVGAVDEAVHHGSRRRRGDPSRRVRPPGCVPPARRRSAQIERCGAPRSGPRSRRPRRRRPLRTTRPAPSRRCLRHSRPRARRPRRRRTARTLAATARLHGRVREVPAGARVRTRFPSQQPDRGGMGWQDAAPKMCTMGRPRGGLAADRPPRLTTTSRRAVAKRAVKRIGEKQPRGEADSRPEACEGLDRSRRNQNGRGLPIEGRARARTRVTSPSRAERPDPGARGRETS